MLSREYRHPIAKLASTSMLVSIQRSAIGGCQAEADRGTSVSGTPLLAVFSVVRTQPPQESQRCRWEPRSVPVIKSHWQGYNTVTQCLRKPKRSSRTFLTVRIYFYSITYVTIEAHLLSARGLTARFIGERCFQRLPTIGTYIVEPGPQLVHELPFRIISVTYFFSHSAAYASNKDSTSTAYSRVSTCVA